MSEEEIETKASTMPPKTMSEEAIKKMVEEMLVEKLKETKKTKVKDKEWDSDSEEEGDDGDERETPNKTTEIPGDQKAFLDALKIVSRDNT